MKVLLTMNLPLTRSYGGANKSNRIMIEELAKQGVEVTAVTPALAVPSDVTHRELLKALVDNGIEVKVDKEKFEFEIKKVKIFAAIESENLRRVLQSTIKQFKPDWIFVSTEDPSQFLFKAAYEVSPDNIIYLGHTQYMLPFGPLSFFPGEKRTALIKKAKSIITISQYFSDYIYKNLGIKSFVNQPPHFGSVGEKRLGSISNKYILMINPCAVKGIDILIGVANNLRDLKFGVVPGWGTTPSDIKRINACQNIDILKSTSDLDSLFKDISLLLMPSIWEEGFGMSTVDALLRGIPVVSSNHGGLPEAKLGTNYQIAIRPISSFDDSFDENQFPKANIPEQDLAPWISAIKELLSDENIYDREAELSKRKAEDFVKSLSVTPLIAHLKSLAAEKSITGSTIHDTSLLNSDEKKIIINRLKEKRNKEIIQNSEILAIEKREFYDVSFSQKQALLIDEMTDKFYGFIMGTTVEFQGVLNIKSLQESLNHLIKRHESLRTRFIKVNSEFKQQILDYAVANIQFEDLTHKADRDNEIAVLVDRCFAERFDLKFAPLIRIIVIKKSNENFLILFSIHHIVCDGLSLNILVSELLKDYNLFAFNKNSEDKNLLKFQYKDFAKWQNEIVNTPYLTEEKRFWHSKLSGKLPTVNLPIDFTRLPIKTFNGKNIKFIIDDTKTKMLREFSNKNDSSLFLTLLGIVQILIYRYTNEDDLIIGVPVAGRNLLSLSDKVGFFVNMIPIRAIINGDDTISTHLIESKRNSSEAISFGKYPFDAILEELNLDRDLSRSPIFDIMVSMSEAGYTVSKVEEEIIGNQGFIVTNTKIGVSHDIAFIFREEKDDLMVEIVFNTDLFRQEKIERMCGHFANIVNVLLENEHIRIKNIPIISENEKEQLLFSLKSGKTDYPKQKLIHQQFEEIAKQFPDRIACQNESFSVSYSELNRKSTCLAALIKKKGVVPDDIIVIICNRSIEMIVDILGVLKSGAAYLPVDPNTPIERFEFIIKNSNAKYILVDEVTKSSMPELNKFNVIENPEDEILFAFEGQSFHTVKSSNLAYIIYTSGTSGYPKGVMIEHRNVMNLILCECPIYHFSRFDIWTLFHSFNFDFSVWEIFGALLHGGKLVIPTLEEIQNPNIFCGVVSDKCISVLNMVPGVFLSYFTHEIIETISLKSLRYIIFGGDTLHVTRLKAYKKLFRQTKFFNMYGITETTVHASFKEIGNAEIDDGRNNIGKAIPNISFLILDENRQLTPKGIIGELYVSGFGVARGYLANERLTEEKFVANPFKAGDILYASGDFMKYLDNWDLEYLGRKDFQVQIRGFRVELSEIEKRVRQFDGVIDAIAKVDRLDSDNLLINVYVVTDNDIDSQFIELRKYLVQFLPRYMLPSNIMKIENIPLTNNGKIDNDSLPLPDSRIRNKMPQPPRNITDEKIFQIWCEVLSNDSFGIDDDFFELGGHSLMAIKVTSRIHKVLNKEIKLGIFFENSSIRELSNYITNNLVIESEKVLKLNEKEIFI